VKESLSCANVAEGDHHSYSMVFCRSISDSGCSILARSVRKGGSL
jgi:hypothetical protein